MTRQDILMKIETLKILVGVYRVNICDHIFNSPDIATVAELERKKRSRNLVLNYLDEIHTYVKNTTGNE